MFKLSIHQTILRFHLMILSTFLVILFHEAWLAVIPMIIAISAILGYRFEWRPKRSGKIVQIKGPGVEQHRKAG